MQLDDGWRLLHGLNAQGDQVETTFFSFMHRLEVDASGVGTGSLADASRILARGWDRMQQAAVDAAIATARAERLRWAPWGQPAS